MASQEGKPATKDPAKRLTKRQLERRRSQTRKVLYPTIAVVAVGVVVAAYVLTLPPPPPPRPLACGEFWSSAAEHIHSKIVFYTDGTAAVVPANIGIDPSLWHDHTLDQYSDNPGQLAPLHTHQTDGIIHVEATVTRGFCLKEFFSIWGQPIGPTQAWGYHSDANHRLSMTVDSVANSSWGDVVFHDNQLIEIHYDSV